MGLNWAFRKKTSKSYVWAMNSLVENNELHLEQYFRKVVLFKFISNSCF